MVELRRLQSRSVCYRLLQTPTGFDTACSATVRELVNDACVDTEPRLHPIDTRRIRGVERGPVGLAGNADDPQSQDWSTMIQGRLTGACRLKWFVTTYW